MTADLKVSQNINLQSKTGDIAMKKKFNKKGGDCLFDRTNHIDMQNEAALLEGREARRFFIAGARKSTIERCSLGILEEMFRVIEKAPVLSNKGFGADKRT